MALSEALDCWYLTGATAVGKTEAALQLARRLDAEVLSMDSMAVYRGMDIGTAKPSPEQQREIPHHLIDPDQDFSVAAYKEIAHEKIREIRARGKEALFVGGTPLYLKCLLRGLFKGPPADWRIRRTIEEELQQVGAEALHARLTQVDPVTASQLHPNDIRRIVRALEVHRSTGEPLSHQQMEFETARSAEECRVFVLRRGREDQRHRIERRVESMIGEGLLDEVRGLVCEGHQLSRTASQAVGYREAVDHLAGVYDLPEMIDRIKARTRRFAKRQGTWFRGLGECRFIDLAPIDDIGMIVDQIATLGKSVERL